MRVALTGGVGSGKTTVASRLADRGAVIIDADRIARDVVRAGTAGFAAVVARFGSSFVGPDGELDRPALGRLVFADEDARTDLNAIVHPLVAQRSHEVMATAAGGAVIVYDVPLLVEAGRADDFDVVVVVEADVTTRLRRLAQRGLSEGEARARMQAQATDEQRRAVADVLIDNNRDLAALEQQIDALWKRLDGLEPTGAIG